MEAGTGSLARIWASRLASADGGAAISLLPELQDAVVPIDFGLLVEEDSYAVTDGTDVSCELRARLIPPGVVDRMGPSALGGICLGINTAESCMEIETVELPLMLQRRGIGRLLLAQLADLADWLGVREIKLEAGRTGRYAWARCGFNFLNPEEDGPRVLNAASEFASALDVRVDLGRIEQPWQLAALTSSVSAAAVEAAGGPSSETAEDWNLGRALLLGPPENATYWYGRLDTRPDSDDSVRLFRYAAGLNRSIG